MKNVLDLLFGWGEEWVNDGEKAMFDLLLSVSYVDERRRGMSLLYQVV